MAILRIYTDGACSGNQHETNVGGWGAVLEYGQTQKELWGGERNTTNNRMEMTALIEALSALKKTDQQIEVFSDSAWIVSEKNGIYPGEKTAGKPQTRLRWKIKNSGSGF